MTDAFAYDSPSPAGFPRTHTALADEPECTAFAALGHTLSLRPGAVFLVVDIGGGTSDFCLIRTTAAGHMQDVGVQNY